MKNQNSSIRSRIESPKLFDVIVAVIITLLFGTFSGEVISRPVNSYLQAICVLGSIVLLAISLRMIFTWISNKIEI